MSTPYTLIPNIEALVEDIQPDSIISRTFYKGDGLNAILFAFDAGQELSEHSTNKTAIIQIVKGEARVTLGEDSHQLVQGAWLHMPAKLKHSVYAETHLLMILLMLDATE